ncbi:YktB family protein [Psychrobacillus sp. FSL K6-1464]|uniref:YktB family protein n=1 Tax=Psychrobacillus sp. FSL K6-1464 TaxID=2921545 RepID=UPI0030F8B5A2
MSKTFWTKEDFDVFQIDGLENRMAGLIEKVRPKFEELGNHYSHYFSTLLGQEYYAHVAKHARRSVNPPKDSWVAFAPYKRGYKALPHFQIGLWGSHAFIILAVIYEAPDKVNIADRLLKKKNLFNNLPSDFIISGDHMKPDASLLKEEKKEGLEQLLVRLKDVKKAEFLVGRHISKDEAVQFTEEEFLKFAEETFDHLIPIYKTMVQMK